MNPTSKQHKDDWQEEAEFFDEWANVSAESLRPIDPLTIRRYGSPRLRRRFNIECRFRVLGSLVGKQVLDFGCGDGINAVLLAKLGAQVTGIDISPKAVELAQQRAEVSGVASQTRFLCSPLETVDLLPESFDVVWGDAVLHHLIAEMDGVLRKLVSWTKPSGVLLFAELINLKQTLRRIRFMIPVKTEATPDERPLGHILDLHVAPFTLLSRLDRFVLENHNYERSAWSRRGISNLLVMMDYVALRIPGSGNLARTAVMYGHPQ